MDPQDQDSRRFMQVALEEAKVSLREGNKGFGAVLARGEIISKTYDTVVTDSNPKAHAEMNLVREASMNLARDLTGCAVISTHEPCPMCTGALIRAKISEVAYGASIEESMKQGRSIIDLGCKEIIKRSPWEVRVSEGILEQECLRLYDDEIRKLFKVFRTATRVGWDGARQNLIEKRTAWFDKNEELVRNELRDRCREGLSAHLDEDWHKGGGSPDSRKIEREDCIPFHEFLSSLGSLQHLGTGHKRNL